MTDWLQLDPTKLNRPRTRKVRGVQINVLLSPYDVPQAVRGNYDQSLQRFVIEFLYLGDEPWRRDLKDAVITLRIGKNSERLLGIEVNVHCIQAEAVELRMHVAQAVTKAIEHLASQHAGSRHSGSYEVAKDAISETKDKLFKELTKP